MILGAVGTGKTSACMYPYVEQLLRWRAQDPDQKVGGLVLEVKGDFCHQVRDMLARAGRADDYLEIGLDTGFCYNPLHNDLDPYAVAYAVATLLNNLFGRGKEPFWQQAYTDLLKFVISLRRITDGLHDALGGLPLHHQRVADRPEHSRTQGAVQRSARSPRRLEQRPRGIRPEGTVDACGTRSGPTTWRTRTSATSKAYLAAHDIPFTVRKGSDAICANRRHRLEAIDRWFHGPWSKLDRPR